MTTSKLAPFSRPTSPIRSAIFKGPPKEVPATEELESLHEELKQLKAKTLERAKKAGEDLKTIEESMRRMKEREKGKAKLIEKVKRERDCAYFLFHYYFAQTRLIMCFVFAIFSRALIFLVSVCHLPLALDACSACSVDLARFSVRHSTLCRHTRPRCGGSEARHQAPPLIASGVIYAPRVRKILSRSPQVSFRLSVRLTHFLIVPSIVRSQRRRRRNGNEKRKAITNKVFFAFELD